MSLLFRFRPLVVNPELAVRIGLNESIVVQQIHYWLTETDSGIEHDGCRWVYNTLEQWQLQFPFWSIKTIKRSIASLASMEVIRVEQLNKTRHDRTNYYAINYESPYLLGTATPPAKKKDSGNDDPSGDQENQASGEQPKKKRAVRRGHIDPIDKDKSSLSDGYKLTPSIGPKRPALSETTTETTPEITADISAAQAADATMPALEGELLPSVAGGNEQPKPKAEIPADMPGPKDSKCKTYRAWANYAIAYRKEYDCWPVWNAQVGRMMSQIIDRVGAVEAPQLVVYYVRKVTDKNTRLKYHDLGNLLRNLQGIRTQWLTGQRMTESTARQQDRTAANMSAAEEAARRIREKGSGNHAQH